MLFFPPYRIVLGVAWKKKGGNAFMEAFQRPPGPQTLWARPVGEGDAKKKRKKKREKLTNVDHQIYTSGAQAAVKLTSMTFNLTNLAIQRIGVWTYPQCGYRCFFNFKLNLALEISRGFSVSSVEFS